MADKFASSLFVQQNAGGCEGTGRQMDGLAAVRRAGDRDWHLLPCQLCASRLSYVRRFFCSRCKFGVFHVFSLECKPRCDCAKHYLRSAHQQAPYRQPGVLEFVPPGRDLHRLAFQLRLSSGLRKFTQQHRLALSAVELACFVGGACRLRQLLAARSSFQARQLASRRRQSGPIRRAANRARRISDSFVCLPEQLGFLQHACLQQEASGPIMLSRTLKKSVGIHTSFAL